MSNPTRGDRGNLSVPLETLVQADRSRPVSAAVRQALSFACVGAAATCVHYLLALLAHSALAVQPLLANLVGYLGAVSISYLGNAILTFRRPILHREQALRFAVVSLAGLLLSQAITGAGAHLVQASFQQTMVAVVVTLPIFSFVASRLWAFAAPEPVNLAPSRPERGSP